jgi:membrane-associated protease RseP (regulator of RpoE activity)
MSTDESSEEQTEASDAADAPSFPPGVWKINIALFLATLASVFVAGVSCAAWFYGVSLKGQGLVGFLKALPSGWTFAIPLMTILLTHEFGHYVAARIHKVAASLPFFIPLPVLSPLGTMGAVIWMPGRIRSRDALVDIGASGPLAGLAVAIPVLLGGLAQSRIEPISPGGAIEGQSLLYLAAKRIVLGPIPDGYDVFLHPMAFAGWAGLLVTALNLIPIGQLDGGHIAYALFGKQQDRVSRILHGALLGMFALNFIKFMAPALPHPTWEDATKAFSNSASWLVWYILLAVILRFGGAEHPPTEPGELSPIRKGVAVVSLVLFVLLFMPTPFSTP